MSVTTPERTARMNELREMIAEVLEVEPEEMTETSLFIEDHDADSLRAIEILARLEKTYRVEIPQEELATMVNLEAIYAAVATRLDWQG
ncbi:acyl carrier protein [Motilibacter deserti]|uniref:Acyl carrier protein n=1 Tax=Motilibacter deserti TaxID=2714956 RepID=A0ABX0H175_9ACTN|nr:acyl carrier protein [Motilibacter deserti]NHC16630.1 acyl carrier protein [Motilibacter deserti]